MKATSLSDVKKGYTGGIVSGLTWGLATTLIDMVIKNDLFTTSSILIVFGAVICACIHDGFATVWMVFFLAIKQKLKLIQENLNNKELYFCMLGAILGGPLGMTLYVLSIKYAGPSYSAIVTSCYPALGVGLAVVVLKEKVKLRAWIGILICILGIIFLSSEGVEPISDSVYTGILFAIGAAVGWASECVICGYGMKSGKIEPEVALTIREITSCLVYALLVIPLIVGSYTGVKEVLLSTSVLYIAAIALIGVLSYLAWYYSINMIGASKAISLNVTYSFWAIVFSLLIIGGEFSLKSFICSFMIICGVSLAVGNPKTLIEENQQNN